MISPQNLPTMYNAGRYCNCSHFMPNVLDNPQIAKLLHDVAIVMFKGGADLTPGIAMKRLIFRSYSILRGR